MPPACTGGPGAIAPLESPPAAGPGGKRTDFSTDAEQTRRRNFLLVAGELGQLYPGDGECGLVWEMPRLSGLGSGSFTTVALLGWSCRGWLCAKARKNGVNWCDGSCGKTTEEERPAPIRAGPMSNGIRHLHGAIRPY